VMVCTLYFMHIYWFSIMISMLAKAIFEKKK
jgi:hypothetical protein